MQQHEFLILSTSPSTLSGGARVECGCACGGWRGDLIAPPGPVRSRDLEYLRSMHFNHAHHFDRPRARADY